MSSLDKGTFQTQLVSSAGLYVKTDLENQEFYTIDPLAFRGEESSLLWSNQGFSQRLKYILVNLFFYIILQFVTPL